MKFKLTAGAELDLITKEELRGELRAWHQEVRRGPKFTRRSFVATGTGSALSFTGDGPAEGFVWAVTRLSVTGPGFDPATHRVSVYINEATPTQLVWVDLIGNASIGDHGLILNGGDSLVFVVTGGNPTSGAQLAVTATIKEVPALMAWSL